MRLPVSMVLALAVAAQAFSTLSTEPLPVVYASGSHFEVGLSLGKAMSDSLPAYVANSSFFQQQVLPFSQSADGQSFIAGLLQAANASFPQYIDELQGMAAGSGVDFATLFLLNSEAEIGAYLGGGGPTLVQCTDVALNWPASQGSQIQAHNEDGDPPIAPIAFLAQINATDEPGFMAYIYPGWLPGLAFGWNEFHNSVSMNAEFPVTVRVGIPKTFVYRSVMISADAEDFVARATTPGLALGFAGNFASAVSGFVNVEVTQLAYAVTRISGNMTHVNLYTRLNANQQYDTSSQHRLAAADRHATPYTLTDALAILGDTTDPQWPIYRNGAAPDVGCATLATVAFDFAHSQVSVFRANPALSSPTNTLPL